jgi:hypothetical protein
MSLRIVLALCHQDMPGPSAAFDSGIADLPDRGRFDFDHDRWMKETGNAKQRR